MIIYALSKEGASGRTDIEAPFDPGSSKTAWPHHNIAP